MLDRKKADKICLALVLAVAMVCAFGVEAAKASKPVRKEIVGCVVSGTLVSQGGYRIRVQHAQNRAAVDLSRYEGKKIRYNGNLLPGDRYLVEAAPIVLGACGDTTPGAQARTTQFATSSARVNWQKIVLTAKVGGAGGDRGILGVKVSDRPQGMWMGQLGELTGALVMFVRKDSVAEAAGLRTLDIIVRFDEKPVKHARHLAELVRKTKPGRRAEIVALRPDADDAIRQYHLPCEKGDIGACANLGYLYRAKDDWRNVFKWTLTAAEKGHLGSMVSAAMLYEEGRGVGRNKAEAVRWYRKAADNGSTSATERLRALGVDYQPSTAAKSSNATPATDLGLKKLEKLEMLQ